MFTVNDLPLFNEPLVTRLIEGERIKQDNVDILIQAALLETLSKELIHLVQLYFHNRIPHRPTWLSLTTTKQKCFLIQWLTLFQGTNKTLKADLLLLEDHFADDHDATKLHSVYDDQGNVIFNDATHAHFIKGDTSRGFRLYIQRHTLFMYRVYKNYVQHYVITPRIEKSLSILNVYSFFSNTAFDYIGHLKDLLKLLVAQELPDQTPSCNSTQHFQITIGAGGMAY